MAYVMATVAHFDRVKSSNHFLYSLGFGCFIEEAPSYPEIVKRLSNYFFLKSFSFTFHI